MEKTDNINSGRLYLIPVPMSSDTTPHDVLPASTLETIKSLKCFFVEELRSARRFLRAVDREFDIDGTEFLIVNEHTKDSDSAGIIEVLKRHNLIGVISEAGCPGIADPGSMVVKLARAKGFRIVPMVGPSSILLGLMGSGFNGQNFTFLGYLPHDTEDRKKKVLSLVKKVSNNNETQIFIETPYRNNKLIAELTGLIPSDMKLCVACNLTSPDEEIIVKKIGEWKSSRYDFSKRPAIFLLGN